MAIGCVLLGGAGGAWLSAGFAAWQIACAIAGALLCVPLFAQWFARER